MDEETPELFNIMLRVIERAYLDVHVYHGVMQGEAPHLMALVERSRRLERHQSVAHALFAEAYAALAKSSVSELKRALNTVLGQVQTGWVN